jgi:hypothetical protein
LNHAPENEVRRTPSHSCAEIGFLGDLDVIALGGLGEACLTASTLAEDAEDHSCEQHNHDHRERAERPHQIAADEAVEGLVDD